MLRTRTNCNRLIDSTSRRSFTNKFDQSPMLIQTWKSFITASIIVLILISCNDSLIFSSTKAGQFIGLAHGQVIHSTAEISSFFDNADDYVNVIVKFKDDASEAYEESSSSTSGGNDGGFVAAMHSAFYSFLGTQDTQQTVTKASKTEGLITQQGSGGRRQLPESVKRIIERNTQVEKPLKVTTHFERTHGVGMKVTKQHLEELLLDDSVETIERDKLVYAYQNSGSEYQNYGIAAIQAYTPFIPDATNTGTCLKVCIVDSGLFVGHQDIPYTKGNSNINGREFNLPSGQLWDNPKYSHGTHVAGIMVAQGFNDYGVRGVLENAPVTNNVCLIIARVFDDDGNGQQDSVVASAVEYCADMGAKIINLSLGSEDFYSSTVNNIYKNVRYNDKALIFAASGNSGGNAYNYPASYDGVISVGAIDKNRILAPFSVTNDKVDVVAPGTDILSTVPETLIRDAINGKSYDVSILEYSVMKAVSSTLVDCKMGETACQNAQGKICLISRGAVQFLVKAQSCQQGGGIAAIIYNNEAGNAFEGTLSTPGAVGIPVVSVTRNIGWQLLQVTHSVSLSDHESGYTMLSGTSMATPFVAGLAAKLWSVRPLCSADQIEQALVTTTQDIGSAGKDNLYGHGLVQAKAAYLYLQKLPAPCGGFAISNEALASSTAFKERQRLKKLGFTSSSNGQTIRKNSNLRHRRHKKRMLQNDADGMNVRYSSDNTTSYSSGYPVSHRQHTSVFVDI